MKPYPIQLEISGPTALWTRPDTGSSPVSYVAPTFSAVKGIFESVLRWKSVNVRPTRVKICASMQFPSPFRMGRRWRSRMWCPRPETRVCEIENHKLPTMLPLAFDQMQNGMNWN